MRIYLKQFEYLMVKPFLYGRLGQESPFDVKLPYNVRCMCLA